MQRAPEDLIRFWVGQSAKSITDEYDKVEDDLSFRQSVASEVGVGFEVRASLGRVGRRTEAENGVEVAA